MEREHKFYMVYSPDGFYPPRVEYTHKHEAQHEAGRLACLNPGRKFYVLSAFEVHERVEPVSVRRLPDPPA